MKLETLESIFRALAENGVRYLVVGGVAVNVHGYQRATQDLDLVVQLDRDNVLRALEALESLPGTTVDIFAAEPFPFEAEWTRAFQAELAPDLRVPCVRIERLIAMKEDVGRPRDRDDAHHLRWIMDDAGSGAE